MPYAVRFKGGPIDGQEAETPLPWPPLKVVETRTKHRGKYRLAHQDKDEQTADYEWVKA